MVFQKQTSLPNDVVRQAINLYVDWYKIHNQGTGGNLGFVHLSCAVGVKSNLVTLFP